MFSQVERLVPLASKAELTEFGHLFVARTRRNLSDSHLWFSVLARPANSRFTRVQRLSCCLCLLFMSMMASGMYYQRKDDPSNVQQIGSVVFTWNQVSLFFALNCSLMRKYFTSNEVFYFQLVLFLYWPFCPLLGRAQWWPNGENLGADLSWVPLLSPELTRPSSSAFLP